MSEQFALHLRLPEKPFNLARVEYEFRHLCIPMRREEEGTTAILGKRKNQNVRTRTQRRWFSYRTFHIAILVHMHIVCVCLCNCTTASAHSRSQYVLLSRHAFIAFNFFHACSLVHRSTILLHGDMSDGLFGVLQLLHATTTTTISSRHHTNLQWVIAVIVCVCVGFNGESINEWKKKQKQKIVKW